MSAVTTVPELFVFTDRHQTGGRSLLDVVRAVLDGGAPAVVLREKDLGRDERTKLADAVRELVVEAGAAFLVASGPGVSGDGVHLAVVDSFPDPRDTTPRRLIGRSCHDVDELRNAATEGCTYATLSPVSTSASKPGYGPPLGVEELGRAARAVAPFPVLALGGVTAANASACRRAGAHGVAVMGAVMRASDPAVAVRDVLGRLRAPVDEPWVGRRVAS